MGILIEYVLSNRFATGLFIRKKTDILRVMEYAISRITGYLIENSNIDQPVYQAICRCKTDAEKICDWVNRNQRKFEK
jgi:hypothetical protein